MKEAAKMKKSSCMIKKRYFGWIGMRYFYAVCGVFLLLTTLSPMERKSPPLSQIYSLIDDVFLIRKKRGNHVLHEAQEIKLLRGEKICNKIVQLIQQASLSELNCCSCHPMLYALEKYVAYKHFYFNKRALLPELNDQLIVKIVTAFLNQGTDVNICNKTGRTALHCAAMTNNLLLAKVLLSAKDLDLNATTYKGGHTPLHIVCAMGELDMLQILMQFRGKVRNDMLINKGDCDGATPLHYLLGKPQPGGVVSLFSELPFNASMEMKNNYNLQCAKRRVMLKRLVLCGGRVTIADRNNWAPLNYAYHYEHEALIGDLQNYVNEELLRHEGDGKNNFSNQDSFGFDTVINLFTEMLFSELGDYVCEGISESNDPLGLEILSFNEN